jgi:hypothetical protein
MLDIVRAVAATLSPRLSAASAQTRPKPREAPVMNQTLFTPELSFLCVMILCIKLLPQQRLIDVNCQM